MGSNTTPQAPRGEIRALTGIRGVAACYVMAYHYLQDPHGTNIAQRILKHGYIAVDLFFVLSGFVMALTYGKAFSNGFEWSSYREFLAKRIGRVYPLYFVVTLAGVVLAIAVEGQSYTPLEIAANLTMTQVWGLANSIDGPAWSISAEFAAYLLFPLLTALALFGTRARSIAAAFAAIAVLIFIASLPSSAVDEGYRNGPLDLYQPLHAIPVLRCIAGFTLGLVAYRAYLDPAVRAVFHRSLVGDLIAIAALVLLVFRMDVILVALIVPLIIALASGRSIATRVLGWGPIHWLGLISYSLYLTHRLVADTVRDAAWRTMVAAHVPHAYSFSGVAAFLATMAVSTLAFGLIEKPGRDLSRRLLHRPPAPIASEPAAP